LVSFKRSFDEDNIPKSRDELLAIMESMFFSPIEKRDFIKKVNEFLKKKNIGLDIAK